MAACTCVWCLPRAFANGIGSGGREKSESEPGDALVSKPLLVSEFASGHA